MDNAPCHSMIEEVFQVKGYIHHGLLRLSPYSPMLNPIELAWSDLNSGVKEDFTFQMPQAGDNKANISQIVCNC